MSEFRSTARAFVKAAFVRLEAEGAIPTSQYHQHLQAHVDFNWAALEELPEYENLKGAVIQAAPEGMPPVDALPGPDFAMSLLGASFLELCVQECAAAENYNPDSDHVTAAIEQFSEILNGEPYAIVVARHVSHLTTASGNELEINGVTIVPEEHQDLRTRIRREIPAAEHAWKRIPPDPYRPPHGLLIVRNAMSGVEYYGASDGGGTLDRFLLTVCLLTGANALATYEVTGTSSRISASPARFDFLFRDTHVTKVRRTARLSGQEGPALAALSDLIDASLPDASDYALSSFGGSLKRFQHLDDTTNEFEQIVELATALEGIILGANEGEGLTLRLCTRTAALLAHDDDPASALFEDLKVLYNLRSTIVHGGDLKVAALGKELNKMSCVPSAQEESRDIVRLGYAVDRLRDIVRRTILARMCLAAGETPRWPFRDNGKTKVDVVLADDANRIAWRAHWRGMLNELGAGMAGERSRPPVYSLGAEDR